jgi:hypothetical protein
MSNQHSAISIQPARLAYHSYLLGVETAQDWVPSADC